MGADPLPRPFFSSVHNNGTSRLISRRFTGLVNAVAYLLLHFAAARNQCALRRARRGAAPACKRMVGRNSDVAAATSYPPCCGELRKTCGAPWPSPRVAMRKSRRSSHWDAWNKECPPRGISHRARVSALVEIDRWSQEQKPDD